MRALLTTALMLGLPLAWQGTADAEPVDYTRQIKPLLAGHCYACHGARQQKSGLRLDTARSLRVGGKRGPAIVPGSSSASLLLDHLTGNNGARRMPPSGEGEALSEGEVALFRGWIDQGADSPADERPEPDPNEHWAFRTPLRPAVPPITNPAPVHNPIDALIAAEWDRHGLTPQPPADPGLLLRRVYLDLVGLPPTREELAAFVANPSPDAYEKVVERLLASPHYGERWGRHWMDVWRYSDWWGLGAEVRNSQKHIWHWRDWIVESLNADKGYDHMLQEMLAADELFPNDPDRLRATGFLARSYFKFNRSTWLDEVVEHTSKAFLGLTMNCARCHDHKYDPIAQADYYRFRAFFEPYQLRIDQVPGEVDLEKDGIPRAFDCNLDTPTYLYERGDERRPRQDRPVAPGVPALLSSGELKIEPVELPPEASSPGLRAFVLEDHLHAAERQIAAAQVALIQAQQVLEATGTAHQTAVAPGTGLAAGDCLFRDDFTRPRPEVWEAGAGKWKHEGGKLLQQAEGETRSQLRAKQAPPANFQARFRFTVTGGEPWRSVGMCFDVAGDHEVLVYVSAQSSGPKVQIAYKQDGPYVYPPDGLQARPIRLNEPLELIVRVRGSLLNVAVNGDHALAYQLPVPRRPGGLQLITYAARAEFLAFDLAALPEEVMLLKAGAPMPARPLTVEQARAAVVLAEKTLAAAAAQPPALRARAAADRARLQQPPAADARELARQAAQAERHAASARAAEDLARAELDCLRVEPAAQADAEKKRDAARDALARAGQPLQASDEGYMPLRGSVKTLESNVETEASRSRPFPSRSTGRRAALARWLTDPRQPLTARVAVNHIWARHFGRPLVPTVFDFGHKGTPPTHPALLDYLACELVEHGWSMKYLHRLLVTSSTYRLSASASRAAPANTAVDPENRYFWRRNAMRMEAEVVRDSLLHLAGSLDPKMGGPPLPVDDAASWRRSLYFTHSHNDHHRFLSLFDNASVLECYRRSESIVPQQALALSNSKLVLDTATRINARLHEELGDVTDAHFARAAFEAILCSAPTAAEQAECERALTQWEELLRRGQDPAPVRRARGDLIHALLNHNDFLAIR